MLPNHIAKIINYPENKIIVELSSTDVAAAVVVEMKITITLFLGSLFRESIKTVHYVVAYQRES